MTKSQGKPRNDARARQPASTAAHASRKPAASGGGYKPQRSKPAEDENAPVWIYGRHAVAAALANPQRRLIRLLATKNAADWLVTLGGPAKAAIGKAEDARPEHIDKALPPGAVHQGLATLVGPLPRVRLKDACADATPSRPVIVLDQVTDPQNIGAIMRSGAALGACAIVVQDRRTPPLSGALAKAAAGAVELLPCVRVVNIARSLEALGELGYFRAALAGEGAAPIDDLPKDRPIALVLGAEGTGLRPLVAATCDGRFRIEIGSAMESLNVSTAAAIALYEATRRSSANRMDA
ncbi:MAG: 23S rRNA (guanosine(2251)-2'-O)-methyltransferase RlmB [Alphaproteobacteria bacterium]|nr:23S rRNA (guanosine(2251)-2'-O)-methyltransferase RlmB [Alphaproteobacteria bacterium]